MIVSFYDKNYTPIQGSSSLVVGKWSLRRRAVDFDDLTLTSEAYDSNMSPAFLVLSDDRGRYYYGAFSGIPNLTKNNQASIQASDLKTLFNNEIAYSFSTYTTVASYFNAVIESFKSQTLGSSVTIDLNVTDLGQMALDGLFPYTGAKKYNVWEDLIVPYLKYYDLFMESKLDILNKKIVYSIKKCSVYTLPLKLWEYGIKEFSRNAVTVNETRGAYINSSGTISFGNIYVLKADNSIKLNDITARELFPTKRKTVLKEIGNKTDEQIKAEVNYEALKILVEARYNDSIEIGTNGIQAYEDAWFDTSFNIYVSRGTLYKKLPLGEILEDNTGVKKLKIGYKVDDLVFYI